MQARAPTRGPCQADRDHLAGQCVTGHGQAEAKRTHLSATGCVSCAGLLPALTASTARLTATRVRSSRAAGQGWWRASRRSGRAASRSRRPGSGRLRGRRGVSRISTAPSGSRPAESPNRLARVADDAGVSVAAEPFVAGPDGDPGRDRRVALGEVADRGPAVAGAEHAAQVPGRPRARRSNRSSFCRNAAQLKGRREGQAP